jgi:hypothetical protein
METRVIRVYEFHELHPTVQENVINSYRDINTDHDWWNFVYEDAINIGRILGISIDKINFSGFSSQGDGAHFIGKYTGYEKGSRDNIRDYAPRDTDLHGIADDLYDLQRRNFYTLTADIERDYSCRYEHPGAMDITLHRYTPMGYEIDVSKECYDAFCGIMRDFANRIYCTLEHDYWYLTSDEAIRETIEANDYRFFANGERE